ncbi:MAG TPA: hypothetical protein VMT85_05085 [Thermoanaerobaculia bacterium]|nr:hypothetical protein [Thermoanaerobaculia bacterium]
MSTASGAHLETAELIEARDGRASDGCREHLASCARCREELEASHQLRARLRALPASSPPRDRWPEVRRRIAGMRRRRRVGRSLFGLAAAAAVIAVMWGGAAASERAAGEREIARLRAHLAELHEQSQLLDAELRALSTRSTTNAQAQALILLEDGLERIDAELASTAPKASAGELGTEALVDRIVLWSGRLELQEIMVQVRHTPLRIGAI